MYLKEYIFKAAAVCAMAMHLPLSGCSDSKPGAIPCWWGSDYVPSVLGSPVDANPLVEQGMEQHPHMAGTVSNTMHADAYASDTHWAPGPLGKNPVVTSTARAWLGGECATVVFDSRGRLVTVCATFKTFELLLLDPVTLDEIASYELPRRPSTMEAVFTLDLQKIMTDTSGGVYFYLDNQDRVVLATSERRIVRIALDDTEAGPAFRLQSEWDIKDHMPADCWSLTNRHPEGTCDVITAVLPDWEGRLWWVTRHGRIGTLDPGTGRTSMLSLGGEEIQNSFAVAEDGVYVVSDHALYGLAAGGKTGTPQIAWREEYDRGSGAGPGSINQGSGTSPTLLGKEYVAITDNAEPRINVLIYRRLPGVEGERLVCRQPVFEPGSSATDNSLIGYGRSVIVENNYGYRNFLSLLFGKTVRGGIARVDINEDAAGCHIVWESKERSPSTVPKLSTGNGLLYLYTKDVQPWFIDAWYLTAVDFRTGETVFKILTGTGWGFDNNWAPVTIGPDGTVYIGTFNGMVAVRDGGD